MAKKKISFTEAVKTCHDKCTPSCIHADEMNDTDMKEFNLLCAQLTLTSLQKRESLPDLVLRCLWKGIHIGITWKGETK